MDGRPEGLCGLADSVNTDHGQRASHNCRGRGRSGKVVHALRCRHLAAAAAAGTRIFPCSLTPCWLTNACRKNIESNVKSFIVEERYRACQACSFLGVDLCGGPSRYCWWPGICSR